MNDDKREYCVRLISSRYKETGVLPRKSDFSEDEVNLIKGCFGPWRYALEAAGLLPSKQEERIAHNREKRRLGRINRKKQVDQSGSAANNNGGNST